VEALRAVHGRNELAEKKKPKWLLYLEQACGEEGGELRPP
jgi:truncated hemoglobin YjbI